MSDSSPKLPSCFFTKKKPVKPREMAFCKWLWVNMVAWGWCRRLMLQSHVYCGDSSEHFNHLTQLVSCQTWKAQHCERICTVIKEMELLCKSLGHIVSRELYNSTAQGVFIYDISASGTVFLSPLFMKCLALICANVLYGLNSQSALHWPYPLKTGSMQGFNQRYSADETGVQGKRAVELGSALHEQTVTFAQGPVIFLRQSQTKHLGL